MWPRYLERPTRWTPFTTSSTSLVEIEAQGNAVIRDLIRASLIVDARFLVLGVLAAYHHQSGGKDVAVASYKDATSVLDAIFAS